MHCHFYQPPRENAWTKEIEPQPSALPFHDWNERILQECYKPNGEAVIVDEHDNVIKRINNYEYFNFDFGPSLLSWIMKKHPRTYEKIIDADKKSVDLHKGHGNAIAMIYSHMIMPLANERDKVTQIKWSLADFKFHFGRESEGMWLPETACNQAVIDVLISEGIKYIILDPSQAHFVRKIKKGKWHDVSTGDINTGTPYRCYSDTESGKYLDIFFYDGPLSKNIAFDDHIFSADKLLARIRQSIHNNELSDKILSVAVDGETFGHHKKYTERTASYLFSELIPDTEIQITNFGEYLTAHQPESEVSIKRGLNGEGTSWSCPHGVGRWKENCGCGSSEEFPSQEWRKPLRNSLNKLRDRLSEVFENTGNIYLKDIWSARNDYINVLLNDTFESKEKFFYFHSKKYLSEDESSLCIKLLEMQRYSMLMFTSCGWFFSDISGIETLQILEYAARAIELCAEITGEDLEKEFLENLSEAASNKNEYKDGKDLYLKEIKNKIKSEVIINN